MRPGLHDGVLARDLYRCQGETVMPGRCDGGLQVHHRLMRSQGGPDTMENLVTLCYAHHEGGYGGVHSRCELAYEVGLLIRFADGPPERAWEPPYVDRVSAWQ